jgi:hypothetical protein
MEGLYLILPAVVHDVAVTTHDVVVPHPDDDRIIRIQRTFVQGLHTLTEADVRPHVGNIFIRCGVTKSCAGGFVAYGYALMYEF